MDKRVFVLAHAVARSRCRQYVDEAPEGTMVTFGPPKATAAQNDKVQPMCREVGRYLESQGAPKRDDDWWRHWLVAKYSGQEIVPDLDGSGSIVVMNKVSGTSGMNKPEKSDFIEWLYAYGVELGMEWEDV